MSRQQAREDSFKMVFEAKIMNTTADELIAKFKETVTDGDIWEQKKETPKDMMYMETVIKGVEEKEEELNGKIIPFLKRWTIPRLAKADLAILQLAVYEILYIEDVPAAAAVNEAVELAKKYGGGDSPSFINGVLRSFIRSLGNAD